MKVQSRARAPLRTVNLLDEEDDDEVPEAPPKIFPMGRGDLSPKRAAREEELEKETCDREEDVGFHQEEETALVSFQCTGFDNASEDPVGPTTGEDDVNYQRVSKGFVDPTIEVRDRFSKLGTPLISRCLAFQGPNIDPYLRYAIEVDVANMVQGPEKLLDLDSLGAGTSSQAAVGAQLLFPNMLRTLMPRVSFWCQVFQCILGHCTFF